MINLRFILSFLPVGLLLSACAPDSPVSVNEDQVAFESYSESGAALDKTRRGNLRPFRGVTDVSTVSSSGPQLCMFAPEYCAERCPNAVMPTWIISFAGEGRATHLGKFTVTAEHCSVVEFDPLTMMPTSAVYGDGVFEIVAANGDRISGSYGRYGEGGDGTSATVSPGVGDFRDVLNIQGGTGRFAGARGMIKEKGLFLLETGAFVEWNMRGWISYRSPDRRRY